MAEVHGVTSGDIQMEMVPQPQETSGNGVSSLPQPKDGGEVNYLGLMIWDIGRTWMVFQEA